MNADASAETPRAVVVQRRGDVAVLKIDRPASRNALTTQVLTQLVTALREADADESVRAVVLTGGTRMFASGADLHELRDATAATYLSSERARAWTELARCNTVVIAAVAGPVLGGGCELALSCDLVVAGDNVVLGQPETRLGLMPGAGGTQRWVHASGRFVTAGLVLAGGTLDAWTAMERGVVHQVVPSECVVEAAVALAQRVAEQSPLAIRLAKSAIRAAEDNGVTAGLAYERSQLTTLLGSADTVEGIDAFLEKRRPRFEGR